MFASPIQTGTSTRGTITAAKAAPEWVLNPATATAMANWELLLAAARLECVFWNPHGWPSGRSASSALKPLVEHPASISHSLLSDEELRKAGISPGLIWLSVGIESAEDLIADLRQALDGQSDADW